MAYIKIDHRYFERPEIRKVGKDAALLLFVSLAYCSQHELKDMIIPVEALPLIGAQAFLDEDETDEAVGMLLNARLWRRGGFPDEYQVMGIQEEQ